MVGHFIPEVFKTFHTAAISSLGGAGVILFFYLSGFLIYRNVQTQSPLVFLTRRFFKLFPAYWVNVIVIFSMAFFLGIGQVPDALTFISNLLMIQEFTHAALANDVYWTLQIEVKFYFLIVLFCYFAGASRIYWLLAALLVLNISLYPFMQRGSTLVTYLIVFFPGIAAAKIIAQGWTRSGLIEFSVVSALAALNLFLFLQDENLRFAIYALIGAGLLAAGLHFNLASRFCAFFGKISYSHYLYHTAIGYPIIAYFMPNHALALGVASCVTVGVATLSFYLVERPAIKLGHSCEALIGKLRKAPE